jgi:hypothetical protein
LPEINQVVEVIFTAVAIPYCANDLLPVVPVPAKYIVSVVIAIVTTCEVMLINVNTVPITYATEEFAGMVNVLALASVDG